MNANAAEKMTLSDESEEEAKFAVKTVVYDSLSKWCFVSDTVPQDSTGFYSWSSPFLSVYPNPASTTLHIHTPETTEPSSFQIMDMRGNVVHRQSEINSEKTIDISSLPNGLYLLSVRNGLHHHIKVITISH